MNHESKIQQAINTLLQFDSMCSGREFLLSSFSKEDMIILHLMTENDLFRDVYTIDTGMLNQETYSFIHKIKNEYGVSIKFLFPDFKDIENMLSTYGPNLFYESVQKRELCCSLRKVNPLKRLLLERNYWITGIRSEQTEVRKKSALIEINDSYKKCNPLLNWDSVDVDKFVKSENIPINSLYSKGYRSIGCAPCSMPSSGNRDGRWWWEDGVRECGIHRIGDHNDS